MTDESPDNYVILIPVFNDWDVVAALLPRLDEAVAGLEAPVEVMLVDDGSTESPADPLPARPLRVIDRLSVIRLRRNLGHQRALSIGISFIEARRSCRAVVIMDGDGEDDPADVPRLIAAMRRDDDRSVVFAERLRRSEGPVFRLAYWLYRWTHRLLTGIPVRVGNFSVVPFAMLRRLVVSSDLWNHYAASVVRARLPMTMVPTRRAPRLGGRSKMNLVSLILHGLSAISVFADRVGVRMLVATLALFGLVVLGLIATVAAVVFAGLSPPAWAAVAAGVVLVLLGQLATLMFVFVFIILRGRDNVGFLPIRDASYFIAGIEALPTAPRTAPGTGAATRASVDR